MMEENKDLTREEKLDIEERAIQALIDMGVKFSIPLKINPVNPPKRVLWWNKHFPKYAKIWRDPRIPKDWDITISDIPDATIGTMRRAYLRQFHIKPLYLGTIDRLRKLYIHIEYDEEGIQDDPIQESKKLYRYIPVMAEIAAVAVLNNPVISDPLSREVTELKQFFMENLTATRLEKICSVINQMMNPGAFTNSIRLIKEIGTTKPNLKADLVE